MNRDGIQKESGVSRNQILANVGLQSSVGCIISSAMGVPVGTKQIVKAGTPIVVNLLDREGVPAVAADGATAMNAVVLHDVDVTAGNANGTALVFGFVNVNRLEADTQALLTTALTADGISPLLVFMKA